MAWLVLVAPEDAALNPALGDWLHDGFGEAEAQEDDGQIEDGHSWGSDLAMVRELHAGRRGHFETWILFWQARLHYQN